MITKRIWLVIFVLALLAVAIYWVVTSGPQESHKASGQSGRCIGQCSYAIGFAGRVVTRQRKQQAFRGQPHASEGLDLEDADPCRRQ